MPPIVTLTLGGLQPARLKLASGLFNLMRNLGGAIGIAVCATILNDRTNLHFLRLAERLTATNETLNGWIGDAAQRLGTSEMEVVLRPLWQATYREAQTQAYSDAFLVIMVAFVLTTLLVPFMRKVVAPKGPSADSH